MSKKPDAAKGRPPTELELENPLTRSLVPDGETPDGFIVFTGLAGRSNRPRFVRLYLSEELDEYVEIAEADVRYSQTIEPPASPLGVTKVWVLQTAAVRHTVVQTRTAQADLIQGEINEAYAANGFLGGSILEQMPQSSATMTAAAAQAGGLSWFKCCKTKSCCGVCPKSGHMGGGTRAE